MTLLPLGFLPVGWCRPVVPGVVDLALDVTGIGAALGLTVGAISVGMTFAATLIYCTAGPRGQARLDGMWVGPQTTQSFGLGDDF